MTRKALLVAACICLLASVATAQVPTGTISGRVTDKSGGVTPGVTVTATSPSLQGPRVVVTSENGDYNITLLPPGDYKLVFELSGFTMVTRSVTVGGTQSVPLDVRMELADLAETVEVSASTSPFLDTAQVATRVPADLMATLPSNRSLVACGTDGAERQGDRTDGGQRRRRCPCRGRRHVVRQRLPDQRGGDHRKPSWSTDHPLHRGRHSGDHGRDRRHLG